MARTGGPLSVSVLDPIAPFVSTARTTREWRPLRPRIGLHRNVSFAPFAVGALVWLEVSGRGTFGQQAPGHALLLASTGLATAGPLLLFAAAARRVPLSTIGLLQFLTPVLQLLCGVLLLGESVPASRWLGFGVVWLALVLLSVDSLRAARRRSRARSAAPALAA